MGSFFDRLTRREGSQSKPRPEAGDRDGVLLYADFQDCLTDHKGHMFAGERGMHDRKHMANAMRCRSHLRAHCSAQLLQEGDEHGELNISPFQPLLKVSVVSPLPPPPSTSTSTSQSVTPLFLGALLGLVPDLLYANYRGDTQYKLFTKHLELVKSSKLNER